MNKTQKGAEGIMRTLRAEWERQGRQYLPAARRGGIGKQAIIQHLSREQGFPRLDTLVGLATACACSIAIHRGGIGDPWKKAADLIVFKKWSEATAFDLIRLAQGLQAHARPDLVAESIEKSVSSLDGLRIFLDSLAGKEGTP